MLRLVRGRTAGNAPTATRRGRWWPSAAPTGQYCRIGAVVHLLATAIEEGRDLSSTSGIPTGTDYRLLRA